MFRRNNESADRSIIDAKNLLTALEKAQTVPKPD